MTRATEAIVIGAGAAGLPAARRLLAEGCKVSILEAGSQVGGLWVFGNDSETSPAYRSLHINSEAKVTHYPDFPFPEDTPLYPSHEQIARYLNAYCDHFDLRRHVTFSAKVEDVRREAGHWIVRTADGRTRSCDVVVVATGHHSTPSMPESFAEFSGCAIHAHSYRSPEPFRGQRVLVIGVGNSALDIAADICTVTSHTVISARSPVLIMPRMMFGVPLSRILQKIEKPWLPWALRWRIRAFLTRVVHGTMEQWGLRTARTPIHPSSHPNIISHFAWRRVSARPGIERVSGRTVQFSCGATDTFDAIIAATGYELSLPFLEDQGDLIQGRALGAYRRIAAPGRPNLYFAGFFNVSGGANIPIMDLQARWIAAVVGGRLNLPTAERMRLDIAKDRQRIQRKYPDRPRYGLELDPSEYLARMRRDLDRAKAKVN